jgi:hypothetical protein
VARYGGIARYLRPTSNGLPSWFNNAAQYEWITHTNTENSDIDPSPVPAGSTGAASKFLAWGSQMFRPADGTIWLGCAGGHTNYSGNEVHKFYARASAPSWEVVLQPTASGDVSQGVRRYADGRPSANHNYWNIYHNPETDRFWMHGAYSVYNSDGGTAFLVHEQFDIGSGAWLSTDDCPAFGTGIFGSGFGGNKCQHPTTGDIYWGDNSNRFFTTRASDLVSSVIAGSGGPTLQGNLTCIDPNNSRMLVAPGGAISDWLTVALSNGASTTRTLTGDTPANFTNARILWDSIANRFLLVSNLFDIYAIDPDTFACSTLSTTGTAPSVHNTTGGSGGELWGKVHFDATLNAIHAAPRHDHPVRTLKLAA